MRHKPIGSAVGVKTRISTNKNNDYGTNNDSKKIMENP